jgi:hypothetical protein
MTNYSVSFLLSKTGDHSLFEWANFAVNLTDPTFLREGPKCNLKTCSIAGWTWLDAWKTEISWQFVNWHLHKVWGWILRQYANLCQYYNKNQQSLDFVEVKPQALWSWIDSLIHSGRLISEKGNS